LDLGMGENPHLTIPRLVFLHFLHRPARPK
jgi:hypothetical protein